MNWQERFKMIWETKEATYRQGSAGQRYASMFLRYVPEGSAINEYGSGTGRAVVEIKRLRPDVKINMIDLADNALEDKAQSLIGDGVTFTLADLATLPESIPVADWGYCVGVLMLVDPEHLQAILKEIRRTCRNLFVEVYNWSDIRLSIELTTIKKDWPEWADMLREHWPSVEYVKSPEHPQRFVFICRSGECCQK